MKTNYAVIIVFVLATMILVACGSSKPVEPTPHPGKALVSTKCSTCHGIAQVDNAKYSREMWTSTVDRMELAGMQIEEDDKEMIIDYLAIRDAD